MIPTTRGWALLVVVATCFFSGCTTPNYQRSRTLANSSLMGGNQYTDETPCCEDGTCQDCKASGDQNVRKADFQQSLSGRRAVRPVNGRC